MENKHQIDKHQYMMMMMYLFTTVPHPHGHWQLQELLGNHKSGNVLTRFGTMNNHTAYSCFVSMFLM